MDPMTLAAAKSYTDESLGSAIKDKYVDPQEVAGILKTDADFVAACKGDKGNFADIDENYFETERINFSSDWESK